MAERDHPLTPTLSPTGRGRDPHPVQKGWAREGEGAFAPASARICLGVIVGVHGVKGLVRIKSFTAEPEAIAAYGALQDESGARRFAIELVGTAKGVLLARLDGIGDRDAAERLKGLHLYVGRDALPEPDEGEFYAADLVGLRAELSDGMGLGRVKEVHDFGAGASLEIADETGKTMLVPFSAAAVPVVDIAAGRVVIVPPQELVAGAAEDEAAAGAGEKP